ncbi:MAG: glucosaminidase domain-containing protein [Alistipes sp.]|nr:glucosaminidase domain-containing protein [Alistipes sp.]
MFRQHNILRKALLSALFALSSLGLMAQQRITRSEYIAKWADVAIEHMEIYGIPASITMAQAIVESGWGNSTLARTANNHFGIKCGSSWTGGKVYHDDDAKGECFRAYDSAEESFADHAEFLNGRSRYQFLFNYATDDYVSWAKGLKQAGYATAPTYAEGLIKVIEDEHLYLLDRKNGRKLYDDYVAEKLGLNKSQQKEEPKSEEPKIADQSLAYADRGIDPNNFRVTINSHYGYNVYLTNGANYIIAREGDTYASIGKLFELPEGILRKFNDVKKGVEPKEGDIVYIERKSSRWRGSNLIHVTEEGEDIYTLSQVYGIRLKTLLKLNNADSDTKFHKGETIRLR